MDAGQPGVRLQAAVAVSSKCESISQRAFAVGLRFGSFAQHCSATFHTASDS